MTKAKLKTRPFDAAHYLNSEEDIAAYLDVVLEDNDPKLLAVALGDIARARGMTELAKKTGLSRESLYKSLSGERTPSTETLLKVIHALGFKLTVTPA
ncbi:putative addiction module antidote protein [Azotobacter chroococcum]|uniref:Addiction module antidote protein n=1 Tax=Azotobacter chroococcum TaxID=353 RepID=A0AA44C7L4_9GAMM|nr:addiction module antidote protein [Azotobacter chroococcum]NHN78589.1 putative addiction module antidote protein [Azotobacter chroococcum]